MLITLAMTPFCLAADTPAAGFTRTKRLSAKITLTVKDKTLRKALDGMSDVLEQNQFGRLRFEISPSAVPLAPPVVNLEVKNQPLSEVLSNLLGPAGLTYTVISGELDPRDGWLRIVKAEGKPVEPKVESPKATEEEEKDAKLKLEAAKASIAEKKNDDAKFLLNYILKKYPATTAAAESKRLLESLNP